MSKKVIIVLGAHRSGTSLLSAGLESIGAYLGKKTNYVSEENPKGFFENEEIVDFNNRLLVYLGGRWDNPLFDGRQSLNDKKNSDLEKWYDEAHTIFTKNFADKDFVSIKDPRICQLLPFWNAILAQNDYSNKDIYYVHIARHPMEVAKSQYRRKQGNQDYYYLGENLMETVSLWLSLSYQSLRDVGSDQNIFLLYQELLSNPKMQLERLASFLRVNFDCERVEKYCNSFVEQDLRRNFAGDIEDKILSSEFPEAKLFFLKQIDLASKDNFSRHDTVSALGIWEKSSTQQHFFKPITTLLSDLASQRYSLNRRILEMKSKLENVAKDKERIGNELKQLELDFNVEKEQLNKVKLEIERKKQALEEQTKDKYRLRVEMDEIKLNMGNKLRELQVANYEMERGKMHAENTIAAMKKTFSWRITKPLRLVKGFFRKGGVPILK